MSGVRPPKKPSPAIIGAHLPRLDAREKVTGAAVYTDDLQLPGMLHGALVRSPLAHARIVHIDTSRALALPGVKGVLTAADTLGVRYGNWRLVPALQDETVLASDRVRFIGDEVAAVCAVDRDTALRAAALVEVQYEELPAVYEVAAALEPGAPELHDDKPGNLSLVRKIQHGDVDGGFAAAHLVLEETFEVQPVSHAYLEPCSSVAQRDEGGRVTLWTSTQTPYIVQCLLASTLGLATNDVRVIKLKVGGGFGGKMELRTWEYAAAWFALKLGRPVKFTLDRHDELAYGRRRHPMTMRCKTGFAANGQILAKEFDVLLDGGAYNAMGATAAFLCGNFGAMLYKIPAYRYLGRYVYTNKPPASAMRGFGAPQALFAGETQMNMAAEQLGIDPIDLRILNAQEAGDVIPDVATVRSCAFKESLVEVKAMSGWADKHGKLPPGKGIGVAGYSFISGGVFNWFDTKYNFASCEVRVFDDGTAHLLTMATDIGQGSDTVLRQILSAELGIDVHRIRLTASDTAITPKADLGTWGSRVTLMVGNAVLDAARKIKEMLIPIVATEFDINQIHDVAFADGRVFVAAKPAVGMDFGTCVAKALRGRRGEPLTAYGAYTPRGKGLVTPTFSFGAQVAEVTVDTDTGVVTVDRMHTAHDCGVAINKLGVQGQLEGSIHMGLGYALCEELVMDGGRTVNTTFLDYKMPAAQDMPPGEAIEVDSDDPEGPYGAKEVGEGLVSPTAPAIADAVAQAVGVRVLKLPITPVKVLEGMGRLRPEPTGTSSGGCGS